MDFFYDPYGGGDDPGDDFDNDPGDDFDNDPGDDFDNDPGDDFRYIPEDDIAVQLADDSECESEYIIKYKDNTKGIVVVTNISYSSSDSESDSDIKIEIKEKSLPVKNTDFKTMSDFILKYIADIKTV